MMRWDKTAEERGGYVEKSDVDAFLQDIIEVYKKHNMTLGHEDYHGAFMVHRGLSQTNIDWITNAHIGEDEE